MKAKKIMGKIMKSVFLETVGSLWKNKKLALLMLLFDMLFLIVIYELGILMRTIKMPTMAALATINMFLYLLIIIGVYSFIKYVVMYYVESLTKKTEFSFARFGKFFLMNVVIIVVLMISLTLLQLFSAYILNQEARAIFALMVTVFVFFFIYPYINFSHSFFTHGIGWKESLAKSLSVCFKRIKKYISVYAISLVIILFFVIVFYLIGLSIRLIIPSYTLFVVVIGALNKIYSVVMIIAYYFLLFVNRAYFYKIAEKLK